MRFNKSLPIGLVGLALLLSGIYALMRMTAVEEAGSEETISTEHSQVSTPATADRVEEGGASTGTVRKEESSELASRGLANTQGLPFESWGNVFDQYLRAAELLTPPDSDPRFEEAENLLRAFALGNADWLTDPENVALIGDWVAANAHALAELKTAIIEGRFYQAPPVTSYDQDIGYLKAFGSLARLLTADGLLSQLRGDDAIALVDSTCLFKMGYEVCSSARFFEGIVGAGIVDLGSLSAARLVSNTADPLVCQEIIAQVGQFRALRPQYSNAIRKDAELLADLLGDPGTLKDLATNTRVSTKPARRAMLELSELPEEELRHEADRVREFLQCLVDAADQPYPEFIAVGPPIQAAGTRAWDFIEGFYRTNRSYVTRFTLSETRTDASQIIAGLKLFKMQTGELPENLGQLVPEYLPAVPTDPFSGKPYRYHRDESKAVLYSVGPDMKDDLARDEARTASDEGDVVFEVR